MELTQTDKLAIIALTGNHQDDTGMEPLTLDDGPRFPYSAIRERITGYAPPAPRSYSSSYESDETPDIGEDEDEETLNALLTAFCVSKQGRDYSGDILPSMRTRGAISAELRSMGCTWGE
jgi:hypothetical protein